MSKKVVWDLFGGLNGSIGLAIGYEEYDIYTIDILKKTKDGRDNIVIDLTMEWNNLKLELDKLPKPDIIVASPMCQSFSRAATCVGGNASWIVSWWGRMHIRTDHSVCKRNYNSERLIANAKLGANAIQNTLSIIKNYRPKFWYIENPTTSLIWKYIFYERKGTDYEFGKLYFNETYYNNYGAPYKKPTTFLSNINLELRKENIKPEISFEYAKGGYNNRSDIPKDLLKEIFKKFNEVEND